MIRKAESRPISVYTDEGDVVQGYAFYLYQQHVGMPPFERIPTIFLQADAQCAPYGIEGVSRCKRRTV